MRKRKMTKQQIEKELAQIDKDLFNIEKAHRNDDISKNKLKAVSVLLFVFIVCMCAFGL